MALLLSLLLHCSFGLSVLPLLLRSLLFSWDPPGHQQEAPPLRVHGPTQALLLLEGHFLLPFFRGQALVSVKHETAILIVSDAVSIKSTTFSASVCSAVGEAQRAARGLTCDFNVPIVHLCSHDD